MATNEALPSGLVSLTVPNIDASKITTGVLALARGGNTFASLGDLIYGGGSGAPTVLSGNTSTTKKFLTQTGDAGPVSAAPAWGTIASGDVPNLSGDVTSSAGTASTVVGALSGKALDANIGTAGAGQDGYVVAWINGGSTYKLVAPTAVGGANAIQIRGTNIAVAVATPPTLDRSVLTYVPANSDWENDYYFPNSWSWAAVTSSSGGTYGTVNMTSGSSSGTGTQGDVAITATAPNGLSNTTAAGAGSSSGMLIGWGNGGRAVTLGQLLKITFVVSLAATTSERIWIGLQDGHAAVATTAAALRSDNPVLNIVGFRYDTASDTKYVCYTGTDGTHFTATAETTSSHFDTSLHIFEIRFDGTNAIFYIDGAQVGSQSTNAPTTSTGLYAVAMIDNIGLGNAKAFTLYSVRAVMKN